MVQAKWTAERDQKLLMIAIKQFKIDYKLFAAVWANDYPNESFIPTATAIEEHVKKLKRDMKANETGDGATPKPKATPKSTTKRAAAKTPSTSNKKARTSRMSDDDDSEGDTKMMDFSTPSIKREPSSRRSKSKGPKSYAELDGDDEDFSDMFTSTKSYVATNGVVSPHTTTAASTPQVFHTPNEGQKTSKARSKKDPPNTAALANLFSDEGEDAFKPDPFQV